MYWVIHRTWFTPIYIFFNNEFIQIQIIEILQHFNTLIRTNLILIPIMLKLAYSSYQLLPNLFIVDFITQSQKA